MKWVVLGAGLCLSACGDDSQQGVERGDSGAGSDTATGEFESGSGESDAEGPTDSEQDATDEPISDDGAPADETDEVPDASETEGQGVTDASTTDDDLDSGVPASTDDAGRETDAQVGTDEVDTIEPPAPEPLPPITLEALCGELRSAWLSECAASERDDCAEVDDYQGAFACAEAPATIEDGKVVFDGSAAAACLAGESFDPIRAWESAYLTGADACWEVFLPNAQLGELCLIDYAFSSACVEGYCPYSGAFEGQCVNYAEEGESCADVFCGFGELYCSDEQICTLALEEDEPCTDGGQCLSGTCYQGICKQPAALGADCTDTACAYPYVCKSGTCVEKVEEGDTCTLQQQCPDALNCIYATPGAEEQACAALPEDGDPCDPRSGCAGERVYCEETEEPGISVCDAYYAEADEACGTDIGNCRPELYCSQNEGTTTEGTCIPDRGLEESCADMVWQSVGNNPCVDGLLCMHASTDTCLPPGALGEPCFYNREDTCADDGTYCSYTTRLCELPVEYGERCNLAFPERSCEAGRCLLVTAEDCDTAPLADCQDSLCLDPFENGSECSYDAQCASDFCDSSLGVPVCADE